MDTSSASQRFVYGFWPEQERSEAPVDPFPFKLLLRWLIPGAAAGLVLLLLLLLAQAQGAKPVVYVGSNGRLSQRAAGGGDVISFGDQAYVLDRDALIQAQGSMPALGAPRWSRNGRNLAATVQQGGAFKVGLFRGGSGRPNVTNSNTSNTLVLPGAGWSPSGNLLAVLEWKDSRARVTLIDLNSPTPTPFDVTLANGAGISWHPRDDFLVVTDGRVITPSLALLAPGGEVTRFAPGDTAVGRGDGAVSPDGKQLAYVAIGTENVQQGLSIGSIWVSTLAAPISAHPVAAAGFNLAPVWAPGGESIFYTHWVTETDKLELRRATIDGKTVDKIGDGTSLVMMRPYDRDLALAWSPDRRRLFFRSDAGQNGTIYVAGYDGAKPEPQQLPCSGVDTVAWAPTSRALVVGCTNGRTYLHWIDEERSDELLVNGALAAWRP